MRKTKEQGITLIALVITIIVLLILAGVALASLMGNSSIIDNANHAVGEYNKSANADQNVITKVEDLFAQYLEGDAEYRIVYYANGGTGTMDEEEASRTGTSTFIPPEGKVFKEWNTSADGSGTSYAPGATVPSNVTLYAIWVSEEIQAQYGNLVSDEEEIHQEYFRYQVLTEPGVARHTSSSGTEGIVSRGDTPVVQKGTAKILGIDWGYFIPGLSTYYTNGQMIGSGSVITTQATATEMQEKLKKLVVPYEVALNDKVYTITEFAVPVVPFSSDSWLRGRIEWIDAMYGMTEEERANYSRGVDYFLPILARNTISGSESADCESSIIIPNSVSSISSESTYTTTIPRNHVILPKNASFNKINDYSFYQMPGLQSITIPDSVTEIGESAFSSCRDLSTVTMSKNLETIGEDAFTTCDSLTSIEIPNTVETIGASAFSSCYSLTSVTFKGSIASIGHWTFSGCQSLTNVTFDGAIETIGTGTFSKCTSLETITIPSSVTAIGGAAFRDCTALKTVTYKGVTYKKIQELKNALTANNVTLGVYQWTSLGVQYNDGAFQNVLLEEDT